MADDAPLPEYPDHTAAFGRIMERLIGKGGDSGAVLRIANEGLAPEVRDLRAITDDELILVSRVVYATKTVNVPAVKHSIDLEIGRRSVAVTERSVAAIIESTAALVDFKNASARASSRLETLTKWLIVFTAAVVLLTVVLAVHDLTH